MRVLFVANPEKAHLLAMVPLAWALRTAGHEVRVASQPAFAEVITQAGLTAVPVGRDADLWQLLARDPRYPDWKWEPPLGPEPPYDVIDDPDGATWEHLSEGYAEALRTWHRPASLPMIAGLVEFAQAWQPDLVLWEPLALGGPIAAKACGAAHGRLLWSLDVFGVARERFLRLAARRPAAERTDPLRDWLSGYGDKHGFAFTEDMVTGQFTVDQLPPSLRPAVDLHRVPMRYVPYGGPAVVPKWLWEPPSRPRVALTMGLSLTDHEAGYAVSVQDVLDALADLDVELVATIPEGEQAKLPRVPANARLVPYVPLQALAPTCAAVINHAGFGTVLTTAQHAVPQLMMPWDFDGPAMAKRAAAQGSAVVIRADHASGAAVRTAVVRLLRQPYFGQRAAALRDEILAMPAPHQVVPQLEELTAKYRTAVR
jgi:glycosyltransferase (activator-dependent family)